MHRLVATHLSPLGLGVVCERIDGEGVSAVVAGVVLDNCRKLLLKDLAADVELVAGCVALAVLGGEAEELLVTLREGAAEQLSGGGANSSCLKHLLLLT